VLFFLYVAATLSLHRCFRDPLHGSYPAECTFALRMRRTSEFDPCCLMTDKYPPFSLSQSATLDTRYTSMLMEAGSDYPCA
jgi:hypothetical protein